jgi:hypothetical protein
VTNAEEVDGMQMEAFQEQESNQLNWEKDQSNK